MPADAPIAIANALRVERVAGRAQFTQAALVLGEYRGWLEATRELLVDDRQASARGEYRWFEDFYSPPHGALLLATAAGEPAGIVGLRRVDDECAELRRLYVRPMARGLGLGRVLVQALLDLAGDSGYQRVVLRTRPTVMVHAQAMYRAIGFRPVDADARTDGPMRMQIALAESAAQRLAA
jgi:GNAT superfamily N-acetyltransferase